jgi:excisionase family DNA binding protein
MCERMNNLSKIRHKKDAQGIHNRARRRLFTLKEAAVYLGRGVDSTRELVYRRELRVIQEGRGKVWIPVDELDRWIDDKLRFIA